MWSQNGFSGGGGGGGAGDAFAGSGAGGEAAGGAVCRGGGGAAGGAAAAGASALRQATKDLALDVLALVCAADTASPHALMVRSLLPSPVSPLSLSLCASCFARSMVSFRPCIIFAFRFFPVCVSFMFSD